MKIEQPNNQNEVLLNRLKDSVINNLGNEQFGVEDLADHVGMSRSNLHRKLKMLRGKSVSQFIREVRLQEAMKLLKQDVGSASEVAFRVGFGSTSYFNTCFNSYFGYPPGEIKRRKSGEFPLFDNNEQTFPENNQNGNGLDQKWNNSHKPWQKHLNPLQKRNIVVALSALILIIIGGYFLISQSEKSAGTNGQKSIAVLPLEHFSGNQDQDYIAAGMHDALIGELGKIRNLRVISKTSTLGYNRKDILIKDIARELGVDVIVEGSVFISGDSIRLQVQLIEAYPEEKHLWAQEYYQNISEVLSLQSSLVKDIAKGINVSLTPDEERLITQTRKINPETFKAFLRGMYYLQKPTRADKNKGLRFLHSGVETDPADPLAYAGLALGYIELGHSSAASDDAFLKAKAAAFKALQIDSTLIEARAAMGRIQLYYEWDWEGAEKTFKYVNKVNPSMATNHYHYAWYLQLMGKKEEALEEHKLAQDLDPLGPKNTGWLGWLYAYYGEFEKAEKEAWKTLELDSNYDVAYLTLGLIKELKGEHEKATEIFEELVAHYPYYKGLLAGSYVRAGKMEEAEKILEELKQYPESPWLAFELCTLYAAMGKNEEALKWLKFKPHHAFIPWMRVQPFSEGLKKDPRFNEWLSGINLPPLDPNDIVKELYYSHAQ